MRRALSSSDAGDLLRAERDVADRAGRVGIDVDLDFASMAAVANVFRVASAARATSSAPCSPTPGCRSPPSR